MGERRGPAPRAVVLLVSLVCALASVAGCGSSSTETPPSSPATDASQAAVGTLVMVIRHGEKPSGSQDGVDPQGKKDSSSLTDQGWARAKALVGLFDPATGAPRAGLAVPRQIYAAGENDDGEGLRPRETVMPLTAKLGLTMNTDYGANQEKQLVEELLSQPGPTLVSWQHGGIPDIAKAFPSVTPKPPSDWPDNRFDVVWTFTRTTDGWRFAQVPEQVLPGDKDTAIKD